MPVFSNTKGKRESFSVSRFIVLPGLLRISAEFLLLSTGPLSYLTQLNRTAWRVWLQRLTTIWLLFWEIGKTSGTIVLQRFRWSLHFLWNLCRIAESTANTGISLCMSENSDVSDRSGWDMAQSPANRGVGGSAEEKSLWADYCLTTIFPDSQKAENFISSGMRPWRSWIARQTPTLKAAGSNPVGRTKISWQATPRE